MSRPIAVAPDSRPIMYEAMCRAVSAAGAKLVEPREAEGLIWADPGRTEEFPEIVAAWRTSGEVDYMLRVLVPDIATYDAFYKRLIRRVDLFDVRTIFVMEELKSTTAVPLDYVFGDRTPEVRRSLSG